MAHPKPVAAQRREDREARRGAGRARLLAGVLSLLIPFLPGPVLGAGWDTGVRLQTSVGGDSNVLEATQDSVQGDTFLRLLGEAVLGHGGLPGRGRGELSALFSADQFERRSSEGRIQGELRLGLALGGEGRSVSGNMEAGWKGSGHPLDSSQDYQRRWGRWQAGIPLGPSGRLRPRVEVWDLNLRTLPLLNQAGSSYDLTFDQPLRSRSFFGRRAAIDWSLQGGLEVGSANHKSQALREVGTSEAIPYDFIGPPRHDSYRLAHLALSFRTHGLYRLEYAYRSQTSNSLEARLRRQEIRWLFSSRLPLRISFQFYGHLERTRRDLDLSRWEISYPDPPEARADDNLIALRLARPVGRGWSVETRASWYRDEAGFVGEYYRKLVWSAGLSWEFGALSGF